MRREGTRTEEEEEEEAALGNRVLAVGVTFRKRFIDGMEGRVWNNLTTLSLRVKLNKVGSYCVPGDGVGCLLAQGHERVHGYALSTEGDVLALSGFGKGSVLVVSC